MTTQQNDAMAMTDQELEQVQGGGPLSGWIIRAWKRWIREESDDVVNSLDELNKYAKGSTDTYEGS